MGRVRGTAVPNGGEPFFFRWTPRARTTNEFLELSLRWRRRRSKRATVSRSYCRKMASSTARRRISARCAPRKQIKPKIRSISFLKTPSSHTTQRHLGRRGVCTRGHLLTRMLCGDDDTGAVQTEIDAHQEFDAAEAGAARGAATCREAARQGA